jgi:hypothetical protein
MAAIGDSLSLLSQMIAAGAGAHIDRRDDSLIGDNLAEEKRLANLYLQQKNAYDKGLFGAAANDLKLGLQDYMSNKAGIQGGIASKRKQDAAAAELKRKIDKDEADRKLKEGDQEEKGRHNKVSEQQGWASLANAKNRASAYIEKIKNGGSGKAQYEIRFEAHADDKEAVTDNVGNRSRIFPMTQGQIDQYAREAINNLEFMQHHPELTRQDRDILGNGVLKFADNKDLAAAYLKEQYDNEFKNRTRINDVEGWEPFSWDEIMGQQREWNPSTATNKEIRARGGLY